MNSKRIVFLLLAVIVAGATAFVARTWLQDERAAIAAQMGGPRQGAGQARGAGAGRAQRHPHRPAHQARRPALAALAAGHAAADLHRRRQAADLRLRRRRRAQPVPCRPADRRDRASSCRARAASWPPCCKPGLRAVSVPATATSTVSGFIYAGDRVDVLLTHALNGDQAASTHATETILRNARVIAMDQKLDFAPGDKPDVAKTATLELTAKQTEIVTLGRQDGRPVAGAAQPAGSDGRRARCRRAATMPPPSSATATPTTARSAASSRTRRRRVKPPETVKPSVFVLRGSARIKQELDGSVAVDPRGAAGESEAAKPKRTPERPPFTRTNPSVPQ